MAEERKAGLMSTTDHQASAILAGGADSFSSFAAAAQAGLLAARKASTACGQRSSAAE